MNAEAVVFFALAAMTVGSAAIVVFARSLIYSAFALLFTFVGVGGLYLLLGADFLAATQLLVYVGGILVLLLFGVMLTHRLYDLDLRTETRRFAPALVVAAGLLWLLAFPGVSRPAGWPFASWPFGPGLLFALPWPSGGGSAAPTTEGIGRLFLGRFLLPFEAASLLLLIALLGAATIVRRRKDA